MKRRLPPSLLFLALLQTATAARPQNCFDDTRYDNGTFENAFGATVATKIHFVMRLDPPTAATLDRVCLCWVSNNPVPNLTFDLVVWDSDGEDGAPGSLLRRFENLEARSVPAHNPGAFYSYDLSAAALTVTGPVYVGPTWDAGAFPGFFICTDYDGPSTQPGYWASGPGAGETAPDRLLGVSPPFQYYVAFGLRAVFTPLATVALSDVAELIVPGYGVDLDATDGRTTLLGLRNTSAVPLAFEIEYHGNEVTDTPRRVDPVELAAQATYVSDLRDDPSGLDPDADGFAEGLAFVRRAGGALPLEGDYFQVDSANDFAAGERLVRPRDFCDVQEIRFLDFGAGTRLQVLIDLPRGDDEASFTYEVFEQSGNLAASGDYFTSDHLNVMDVQEIAPAGVRFGTVVFDFTAASGGWVSARYSAFGRFSVELGSACRLGATPP